MFSKTAFINIQYPVDNTYNITTWISSLFLYTLLLSFNSTNTVLLGLATRPFDAMKYSTSFFELVNYLFYCGHLFRGWVSLIQIELSQKSYLQISVVKNLPWWPSGLSCCSNSSRVAAKDSGLNPAQDYDWLLKIRNNFKLFD